MLSKKQEYNRAEEYEELRFDLDIALAAYDRYITRSPNLRNHPGIISNIRGLEIKISELAKSAENLEQISAPEIKSPFLKEVIPENFLQEFFLISLLFLH